MNVNNLVINRALSAWMRDKTTGDMIFRLIDVKDPSLEVDGEQVYKTDSLGQKIASFDRNKEAKISCSSSLFDLNLLAAQLGGDKTVASSTSKIEAPVPDVLTAASGKITLTKDPIDSTEITEIMLLNDDGSTAATYSVGSTASKDNFTISGKTITLPTGASDGTRWFVRYTAEYTSGVEIAASVDSKTASGEFTVEVLFCDPCDQSVEYHGYVIFPNGKLINQATIEMNVEAEQQFTVEAMLDWCSSDKKLFRMIVVE